MDDLSFPLFQHFRDRPLRGEKTAFQVDIYGLIPEFLRMMGQIGAEKDASAVDQDIQLFEFLNRFRHHPVHVFNFGYVCRDRQRLSTVFLYFINYLAQFVHPSSR